MTRRKELMDEGLLLINDFSKLTGLSRKALYLYDEQNLLSPAFVHSETDYRYYHQNQLLTAKRIRLLKQAGFGLKEIKQVFDEQLDKDEIQTLIEQKVKAEEQKIIQAKGAIEQLKQLTRDLDGLTTEETRYVPAIEVTELPVLMNENICVVLNEAEKLLAKNNATQDERIIKYRIQDGKAIPVAVAFRAMGQNFEMGVSLSYFGFNAQIFRCEVNPYQEESPLKILDLMEKSRREFSAIFVYERILNPDDFLYSTKRFSEFIIPIS